MHTDTLPESRGNVHRALLTSIEASFAGLSAEIKAKYENLLTNLE